MQYAQDKVKKMRGTKRSKSKGASKRAKVSTASATFKAAVAKEVVKQKSKDMGYKDDLTAVADTAYTVNASGTVVLLPTPSQGAAETERVGKKMLWHSCQLRGKAYGLSSTAACRGFIAIIYDREPTGSLPAFTDIFQRGVTNGSVYASLSMLNPASSTRFSVVMRRDFIVTAAGSDNYGINIEEWIDLKKRECVFKGATGGYGDIQKGALLLVFGSDENTENANFGLRVNRRTRFIDV